MDGFMYDDPFFDFDNSEDSAPVASPIPTAPPMIMPPVPQKPLSPSPAPVSYRKSKWTPDEDNLLRRSVEIHGNENWTAVATLVPGRNPKQCRERWTAQLDPALTRDDWTPQEDAILLHVHKSHGNSWARIAAFLPGRSSNAVKNRYNWLARRHLPQQMEAAQAFPMMPMHMPMHMPHWPGSMPTQYNIPMSFSMPMLNMGIAGYGGTSNRRAKPKPAQAMTSASSDNDQEMWDDDTPFDLAHEPMDDLTGDFGWFDK